MLTNNHLPYQRIPSAGDSRMLSFLVIWLACINIFAFKTVLPIWFAGRCVYILFALAFLWFHLVKHYTLRPEAKAFVITLIAMYAFHVAAETHDNDYINGTLLIRLIPVYLLAAYMCQPNFRYKPCCLFAMAFFLLECGMSIYERMTMSHIIGTYKMDDAMATAAVAVVTDSDKFRSTALMFHPLFNANTVSIAMAFIMCANRIKVIPKLILMALGFGALWGFNSRGVLVIWCVILLYRFAFYNRKWWQMTLCLFILYLALPLVVDWYMTSSTALQGRLGDLDFSDSSSETRFIAFALFANADWTWERILLGGPLITYPGFYNTFREAVPLENGVLLDLCYWGWIGGAIKIVCEMLVTYFAVHRFPLRARILIMMATWGVAFTNNNSYQYWLMPMFTLFCIGSSMWQDAEEEADPYADECEAWAADELAGDEG